jgi:hypothetical protein
MTLISYQHTARRGDKKYAPREVDIAMRIIAIASYKKRVRLEAELHIGQSGQWPPPWSRNFFSDLVNSTYVLERFKMVCLFASEILICEC